MGDTWRSKEEEMFASQRPSWQKKTECRLFLAGERIERHSGMENDRKSHKETVRVGALHKKLKSA
jgi:hypothetical protein